MSSRAQSRKPARFRSGDAVFAEGGSDAWSPGPASLRGEGAAATLADEASPPRSTFRLRSAALGMTCCFILTGCPRPPIERVELPPSPTPTPSPTPINIPYHKMEMARLFSGLKVQTSIEAEDGTTATADRNDPASYSLDLTIKVRVPKANTSLSELAALNAQLPKLLPALETMLPTAKVAEFYDDMYRRKVSTISRDLPRLEQLISRHNFYDCETILNLEHPHTKRRVVLVQSDMDVVMDGSDSDRVPNVDGTSANFQPTTSYRWPKKTATPNPFLQGREEKLKQAEQELAKGAAAPRTQELKAMLTRLRAEVDDLKKNSFLVSTFDPFVVLPGPLLGGRGPFAPKIGDYCVVIFNDKLYPAIVGDAGPTYKTGEASLRLCKELNPSANAMYRPVNDLKVTYLVFPNSGERPWTAPNLDHWRTRCEELLIDAGGYAGELKEWEDLTKPKPTPSSTPTPTASPSATVSASPTAP